MSLILLELYLEFDILCFSVSKILECINSKTSIYLEGYEKPIGMSIKATKGRVLMYVKNGINFVQRNDLDNEKIKN